MEVRGREVWRGSGGERKGGWGEMRWLYLYVCLLRFTSLAAFAACCNLCSFSCSLFAASAFSAAAFASYSFFAFAFASASALSISILFSSTSFFTWQRR